MSHTAGKFKSWLTAWLSTFFVLYWCVLPPKSNLTLFHKGIFHYVTLRQVVNSIKSKQVSLRSRNYSGMVYRSNCKMLLNRYYLIRIATKQICTLFVRKGIEDVSEKETVSEQAANWGVCYHKPVLVFVLLLTALRWKQKLSTYWTQSKFRKNQELYMHCRNYHFHISWLWNYFNSLLQHRMNCVYLYGWDSS